jgi:hypothetical protein
MLVPLARSLSTFYNLFREALVAKKLKQYEPALDAYIDNLRDEDALRVDLAAAGIREVSIEAISLPMSFETGTDFFEHPLVDLVYMPSWTRIIEDQDKNSQVFESIIDALDTYFSGVEMTLEFRGASLLGHILS